MNLKSIFIMVFLLFFVGCQEFNMSDNNPEVVLSQFKELSDRLDDDSSNLDSITKDITKNATVIKESSQRALLNGNEKNLADLNLIRNNSEKILLRARDLSATGGNIIETAKKIKSMEKKIYNISGDYIKLEEELVKAKEDVKSKTVKMLQGIIGLGVLGFGVSIALFFLSSPKIGIAGAAASVATIVLAMGISKYFIIIALSGALIVSAIVIYLIIEAIRHKKAIKEVVETVEAAKENMTDIEKAITFGGTGPEGAKGIVKKIQSPSTENLVKLTKSKIKKPIYCK